MRLKPEAVGVASSDRSESLSELLPALRSTRPLPTRPRIAARQTGAARGRPALAPKFRTSANAAPETITASATTLVAATTDRASASRDEELVTDE